MLTDEIQTITITREELKTVEFKTSTADLQGACETLCGFLNDNGGKVLIGVKNNGTVVGQMVTDKTRQEISNKIKKFEPPAEINVKYESVGSNKFVIIMRVKGGPHAPYVFDGRPYQRIETTTTLMSQHLYEQLLVERGHLNHDWESFAAWKLDSVELDHEEIARVIIHGINVKRIPENALNDMPKEVLQRFQLLDDENLKNAGMVLFAKHMPGKLLQCTMRMARFNGLSKTNNFIDNQAVCGNAFKLLDEASDFIRRHMSIAGFYQQDSFIRLDKPTLPVLAVREALINAICHRDYQTSSSISMAIFDDRLEIWNPGMLPRGIHIDDLHKFHDSVPRNQLIANVFYSRGMIEMWGTGTVKIFEGCKEHGIPPPIFQEISGGVLVTFMYAEPMRKVEQNIQKINALTRRQQKIFNILGRSIKLTSQEIYDQLGESIAARTLRHELSIMRRLGLIESKGRSSNAFWYLVYKGK